MIDIDWKAIKPGDQVLLKYTGYYRVPLWLDGNWAKVLRRKSSGNLEVQASLEAEGCTRTIQQSDIRAHKEAD